MDYIKNNLLNLYKNRELLETRELLWRPDLPGGIFHAINGTFISMV